MATQSKRMTYLRQKVADLGPVDVPRAVKTLKGLEASLPSHIKPCKFDQTVELAARLGVDPKQADQIVRGSIVLPNGIGKSQRVLVFAQGDNLKAAQAAGADHVGGKELADKIKEGWLDFDVAIATPDMMGLVGPLGRVLGPRGLMPSPRAGTVTQDVANTVKEYKAGKVEFRCDAAGIVHCVVGKISFAETQLVQNVEALIAYIHALKPSGSKGVYVRSVTLSATMSPGILIAA
ncbi:MAG: 50S ribosomal protein L1 [Planctomycetaceae bacterium]